MNKITITIHIATETLSDNFLESLTDAVDCACNENFKQFDVVKTQIEINPNTAIKD